MPVDRQQAARAIEAFLRAIGRDPEGDPELRGTGARVTEAFVDDLCAGYSADVPALLAENTLEGHTGLVVVRGLAVTTTCPHHLMQATGTATVAFAPTSRLVGVGTLGRVVDAFARRLTLQEVIGESVVQALHKALAPRWAACRLDLTHGCMTARGERRHGARVVTLAVAGEDARGEVHAAMGEGA